MSVSPPILDFRSQSRESPLMSYPPLIVDQKYAIEFANDKSLGLVQFTAMGTILVGCTGMITVQTESTANAHWNNQLWITPGYFINSNTIKQTMYQQSWGT